MITAEEVRQKQVEQRKQYWDKYLKPIEQDILEAFSNNKIDIKYNIHGGDVYIRTNLTIEYDTLVDKLQSLGYITRVKSGYKYDIKNERYDYKAVIISW